MGHSTPLFVRLFIDSATQSANEPSRHTTNNEKHGEQFKKGEEVWKTYVSIIPNVAQTVQLTVEPTEAQK